jgi:hypothetical protein
MNKVIVSLECGCFKKSDFTKESEFSSLQEAENKAKEMAEYMNNNFCQKHIFEVVKSGDDFTIEVKLNN